MTTNTNIMSYPAFESTVDFYLFDFSRIHSEFEYKVFQNSRKHCMSFTVGAFLSYNIILMLFIIGTH